MKKLKQLLYIVWYYGRQQKVSRLGAQRMSAGSAFQARGPATDSARSPILVTDIT